MKEHIVFCWKAMWKKEEIPAIDSKSDTFNQNVSFLEASTESLPQFTLSNIILRVYGVSDSLTTKTLQYFSLISSAITLPLAYTTVSNKFYDIDYIYIEIAWNVWFQRQTKLQPLSTPESEKSMKGICIWLIWKLDNF